MLRLEHVTKIFHLDKDSVTALDDIELEFDKTGFVFIEGKSGSGKTTLINVLTGLDSATEGKIYYNDREFLENDFVSFRNKTCGIVFQNFNLIEDYTVRRNLSLIFDIQEGIKTEEIESRIKEVLSFVDMEGFEDRKIKELSGGQQQRIAIARAIIKKPEIIMADEATGNLDGENTEKILDILNKLSKKCLVVLVSHNQYSSEKYADRIIKISKGKIVKDEDNRELKKLYEQGYQVKLKGDAGEKQGLFSKLNLKKALQKVILIDEPKQTVTLELEKQTMKEPEEMDWKYSTTKIKNISLKKIFWYVKDDIKKKISYTVVSMLAMAFVSALFILTTLVVRNDFYEAVNSVVQTDNTSYHPVVIDDGHFRERRGKVLADAITKVKNISYVKYFTDNYNSLEIEDDELYVILDEHKKWVTDSSKVVVSKELSKQFKIGDDVKIGKKTYQVGAVCEEQIGPSKYFVIISWDYYVENYFNKKQLLVLGVDLSQFYDASELAKRAASIEKLSRFKQQGVPLINGRYPESDNEVLVSSQMKESITSNNGGKMLKNIRLPKVDDYNTVNLRNITGPNIKIVGVYDEAFYKEDCERDITFTDSCYNKIIEDDLNYIYDGILVDFYKDGGRIVRGLEEQSIYIDDTVCEQFYAYSEFADTYKKIICLILCVLIFFTSLIMSSYLKQNIRANTKKIGILKAVGFSNKDTGSIYLCESLVLLIGSMLFAVFFSYVCINAVNGKIAGWINHKHFQMIIVHVDKLLQAVGIICLIGIIISYKTIYSLIKNKVNFLINHEE